MPAAQESVTLTFVFTDLVGSTELLQRLGEEKARLVFELDFRRPMPAPRSLRGLLPPVKPDSRTTARIVA